MHKAPVFLPEKLLNLKRVTIAIINPALLKSYIRIISAEGLQAIIKMSGICIMRATCCVNATQINSRRVCRFNIASGLELVSY